MLVHTHIPKTGGTTLNHLLKTAYGWGFRQIRPSVDPWAHADLVPNVGNVQHLDEIKLRAVDKCLSSHWLFVEDAPATYILCYRDPIKRMVSDYAHKAELLGGLPDIDAFLRPRLPLQSDFMSGIVGVERFKDMVRDGRVIAVRTESLNDDLAALGAFGFGHRKNTAKGRRFYEEAKEIVHKNVSTEDIVQDIEIVRWLDENRQQAFRPLIPAPKEGRYCLAEARRRLRL